MVVLTPRFTLLAALSSIAAISLVPTPAQAAAIQARHPEAFGQPIAARHSASHGHTSDADDDSQHSDSSDSDSMKASSSKSKVAAAAKNVADKPQRHAKPVVPLPARMAQKSVQKASSSKKAGGSAGGHSGTKGSEHAKSRRAVWSPSDPVSRIERFWMASQDVRARGMPTPLDRRHHHDHDDRHHEKVIVDGNNDHVDVHRRSLGQARVARAPHDDHDRILVEGHDDHVHVHDEDRDGDHDRVVVKGDGDHVHVHRSPNPHHHHGYDHDEVKIKGDHDSVHFHRSPEPTPHHDHHSGHRHDTVVVKGDDDHVNVHRRSPAPRHRHHRVIVKGNNQHVHVGRSPSPAPEPHSHDRHHGGDRVVVNGDHDDVHVHGRSFRSEPIVISGYRGEEYHIHPVPSKVPASTNDILGLAATLHLRRDAQNSGVPGSIEIMSQVANSTAGQRIASLVLAASGNGTTADNSTSSSPFVLNASGTNSTQLYLVPVPTSDAEALSSDSTSPASFIKVALQVPVFDPAHAQLNSYCATFDPRPAAPAEMTVEECLPGSSDDQHKSQVFAYEPGTGAIRPMWFNGEDDGAEDDDSDDSAVPTGDPADDDDGSDDDLGGANNSTTVDPTTPNSSKVVNVTSLQDEALDEQYGDATRPPTRMASVKSFAADSPAGARNVTLVFTPATPEVPSLAPPNQEKVISPPSSSGEATSTGASDSATATGISSAVSGTSTSVSVATTTDTATSSVAALDATSTLSSSGPVASSDTTSATSSSATSSASSTATDSTASASASATAPSALEVKVYNPYAEAAGSTSSSATSFSVTSSSATSSSATATMTPVSTAPYEWMFKQRSVADLD